MSSPMLTIDDEPAMQYTATTAPVKYDRSHIAHLTACAHSLYLGWSFALCRAVVRCRLKPMSCGAHESCLQLPPASPLQERAIEQEVVNNKFDATIQITPQSKVRTGRHIPVATTYVRFIIRAEHKTFTASSKDWHCTFKLRLACPDEGG